MSLLRISGLSPRPGAESHGRLVSRCECLVAADQLASDTPVGCARALALTVISSGNAEVVHRDGEVKKKYRKKAMGWNGEREEEKEREVRTERRTDVARIAKGSSLTPPLSLLRLLLLLLLLHSAGEATVRGDNSREVAGRENGATCIVCSLTHRNISARW